MNKLLLTVVAGFAAVPLQIALAHSPEQAPHQIAQLGALQLEGGVVIDNLRMSYVTHGTLSDGQGERNSVHARFRGQPPFG